MMNEPTIEKLRALRLKGMLARWLKQQKDPKIADVAFDERFGWCMPSGFRATVD